MALLDLQGMDQKPSAGATKGGGGNKSASSKGCGNVVNVGGDRSHLSLLLC